MPARGVHKTIQRAVSGPGPMRLSASLSSATTVGPGTPRDSPQTPYSRPQEGILCTILDANFAEFSFRNRPKSLMSEPIA
jgi:hypothetical protein